MRARGGGGHGCGGLCFILRQRRGREEQHGNCSAGCKAVGPGHFYLLWSAQRVFLREGALVRCVLACGQGEEGWGQQLWDTHGNCLSCAPGRPRCLLVQTQH